MQTIAADLSPETAAWVQAHIAMSTARAVTPLREELNRMDDCANGLFLVPADVLPLLREHPHMSATHGSHAFLLPIGASDLVSWARSAGICGGSQQT